MREKKSPKKTEAIAAPRRDFLTFLWVALGLGALAEMIWLAGSFLRSGKGKRAGRASAPIVSENELLDRARVSDDSRLRDVASNVTDATHYVALRKN